MEPPTPGGCGSEGHRSGPGFGHSGTSADRTGAADLLGLLGLGAEVHQALPAVRTRCEVSAAKGNRGNKKNTGVVVFLLMVNWSKERCMVKTYRRHGRFMVWE